MSIYSLKYKMNESAAVQDPDNPGNDLDQIEKEVLASHDDEVEQADSGVVGDPLEEAFMLIYESEYNDNQILQVIGLNELSYAAMGKGEFILEGENSDGWFAKMIQAIQKWFKKAAEAVVKFVENFSLVTKRNKQFVAKYEKDILAGADNLGDKAPEVYPFKADLGSKAGDYKNALAGSSEEDMVQRCNHELSDDVDMSAYSANALEAAKTVLMQEYGKKTENYKTLMDLSKDLYEEYRGSKTKFGDGVKVKDVVEILKDENEVKAIRDASKTLKTNAQKKIDALRKMQKGYNKVDKKSKIPTIINYYYSLARFELNAYNTYLTVLIRCAKQKRNQAFQLANLCRAHAPKAKETKKDATVQLNSASVWTGSLGNINLV